VKRRPFTILSALSLLPFVAVVALWVRSDRLWESATYQSPSGRLYTVTSRLDAVEFDVTDGWPAGQFEPFEVDSDPVLVSSLPPPSEWHFLGFGLDRRTQAVGVGAWSGPSSGTSVVLPHWFVLLTLAVPPLLLTVNLLRRPRRPGLCRHCGYDLRATPERCPECGTPAAVTVEERVR
jgi:hypothetical protein